MKNRCDHSLGRGQGISVKLEYKETSKHHHIRWYIKNLFILPTRSRASWKKSCMGDGICILKESMCEQAENDNGVLNGRCLSASLAVSLFCGSERHCSDIDRRHMLRDHSTACLQPQASTLYHTLTLIALHSSHSHCLAPCSSKTHTTVIFPSYPSICLR